MSWIWINIPLCALMVAFTVGLPAWVLLKYPEDADTDTDAAHAPVPRTRERSALVGGRQHDTRSRTLSPDAS